MSCCFAFHTCLFTLLTWMFNFCNSFIFYSLYAVCIKLISIIHSTQSIVIYYKNVQLHCFNEKYQVHHSYETGMSTLKKNSVFYSCIEYMHIIICTLFKYNDSIVIHNYTLSILNWIKSNSLLLLLFAVVKYYYYQW